MKVDLYTKAVLTAIAVLLAVLAFRQPQPVLAQNSKGRDLWIEPGYTAVRKPDGTEQVQGKIVVDRLTGDIWGFPTGTGGPYPVDIATSTPPVAKPVYLGKFDFSAMRK
jgi:hypothetical protein